VVELRAKHPAAIAWVGTCQRINPDRWVLSTVFPRDLERDGIADWGHQGFFYQPSCFFAADAWHQAGQLDEDLHYAFDLDLWLRLSRVGSFTATPRILSAATIHPDAKTRARRTEMYAETAAVQIKHGYQGLAVARLEDFLKQQVLHRKLIRGVRWKARRACRRLAFWQKKDAFWQIQSPLGSTSGIEELTGETRARDVDAER
jgi:GT2 family glycosyltransferase